jgi:hypothetical protein
MKIQRYRKNTQRKGETEKLRISDMKRQTDREKGNEEIENRETN